MTSPLQITSALKIRAYLASPLSRV